MFIVFFGSPAGGAKFGLLGFAMTPAWWWGDWWPKLIQINLWVIDGREVVVKIHKWCPSGYFVTTQAVFAAIRHRTSNWGSQFVFTLDCTQARQWPVVCVCVITFVIESPCTEDNRVQPSQFNSRCHSWTTRSSWLMGVNILGTDTHTQRSIINT